MNNLPVSIAILMGVATFLTVLFFYKAARHSKVVTTIIIAWLVIQSIISITGYYTVTDSTPPRFTLLVIPPLLGIIALFIFPKGKSFLDSLDIKYLTILHIVRVPVEITLFLLFTYKTIPVLMTFEGRNFDILSGLTAPLILYFGFIKRKLSHTVLLAWNFICLGLLVNIVTHAILSAPFPFQQLAFDQPNIAVLYFPYVWLPCCIVPLVFLSHLASIRQLILGRRSDLVNFKLDRVKAVL